MVARFGLLAPLAMAAAELGVSQSRVYQLAQLARLRVVVVFGVYHVPASDIEARKLAKVEGRLQGHRRTVPAPKRRKRPVASGLDEYALGTM